MNNLFKAFDDLAKTPFNVSRDSTTADKIKYITWDILMSDDEEKHEKAAVVFKEWLEAYGDVGIKAIPEKARSMFPLPLKPSLVRVVQDIVSRRGLMDDVFTREQEWGMGIAATKSIEETVQAGWAAQKSGKGKR